MNYYDLMYGGSGMSGSSGKSTGFFDGLIAGGTAVLVVTVLLIIAFFVACIVGYIVFLGKNPSQRHSKLGGFFNFDRFYVEKVLKVLFLINVCATCLTSLLILVVFCLGGFSGFLIGLIVAAIIFFLAMLITRCLYEFVLLLVCQASDIRAIRRKIVDGIDVSASTAQSASEPQTETAQTVANAAAQAAQPQSAQAQPAQPQSAPAQPAQPQSAPASEAPASKPAPAPKPPAPKPPASAPEAPAPEADTWACACGKTDNRGAFCTGCGAPRP